MWKWLKENWLVAPTLVLLAGLWVFTSGRSGNPMANINELKLRLKSEKEEKARQIEQEHVKELDKLKSEHAANLEKIDEKTRLKVEELSKEANSAKLINELRRLYGKR
jgi:hypothetical protein